LKGQFWESVSGYKYGDDAFGIVAYFGHWPTPADMERCFEGTSRAVWGNILRGGPAGYIYAEIISGIKRDGFEGFAADGYNHWTEHIKLKSSRHLKRGRRSIKRAVIELTRLPHKEPLF